MTRSLKPCCLFRYLYIKLSTLSSMVSQIPSKVMSSSSPWLDNKPFFFVLNVHPGNPNSLELVTPCRVASDIHMRLEVSGILELTGPLVEYLRNDYSELELRCADLAWAPFIGSQRVSGHTPKFDIQRALAYNHCHLLTIITTCWRRLNYLQFWIRERTPRPTESAFPTSN